MFRRVKTFYGNIRRVCQWLPVIWKDRYFDYAYLLEILEYKLRYDAKHYRMFGWGVDATCYAKQMEIAAELCRRIRTNNYYTPWNKEVAECGRRLFEYMENNVVMYNGLKCHSSEGYEHDELLAKKASWARVREEEMRKQDLDYLITLLRKHLFYWWD
jgi:hypothetical protein